MNELMKYIKSNKRVCPQPQQWNKLWEMLPDRKRKGAGWIPPLPLILAAWWETSDQQKRERLECHIQYASDKEKLEQVRHFLENLLKDEWLYEGEI